MGYDIWANGEFQIEVDKKDAAIAAIRKAIDENPNAKQVTYKVKADPNDPISALDLYFQAGVIEEAEDGTLMLHFGDDCIRHEEYDLWLFQAAAPFCDPASEIFFKGEDGYEWSWDIEDGKVVEVGSDTVWGDDIKAPAAIQKIVEIVYHDGKPLSSLPGDPVTRAAALELAIANIETVLRDNNFGPQAGMSELERLADV